MTDDFSSDVHDFEPHEQVAAPEPGAAERLRAFEDEALGPDAIRIRGDIERGSGSWFQTKLTAEQREHHAALSKLIETEKALGEAKAALAAAEEAHAEAEAAAAHG